jgi:hypothetical protein
VRDPQDAIRWALCHDAVEGMGLRDMASPVKRMPWMAGYRAKEQELLMTVVADRFRLPKVIPALVKVVDAELGKTERDQFMGPEVEPWPNWENVVPLELEFPNWDKERAAAEWLSMAKELGLP